MHWHTYANYVHILMSCYRCCHVSDILVSNKWAIWFIWLMHVCARTTHISYWINHRFTTAFCLERCVFFIFYFYECKDVFWCFLETRKKKRKEKNENVSLHPYEYKSYWSCLELEASLNKICFFVLVLVHTWFLYVVSCN